MDSSGRTSGGTSGDTAASLFRRTWNAQPASLGHPVLDSGANGSGLRAMEALLLVGAPDSGKTNLVMQWMASHLVAGGQVTYIAAPDGHALNVARLVTVVEHTFCRRAAGGVALQYQSAIRAAGGPQAVMAGVRDAMSRLTVGFPTTIADLCGLFSSSQPAPPRQAGSSGGTGAGPGIVPLVVVDGLGAGCSISVMERVEGLPLPVGAMLTRAVESQGCALIAVETRNAPSDTMEAVIHQSQCATSCRPGLFRYVAQTRVEVAPGPAASREHGEPADLASGVVKREPIAPAVERSEFLTFHRTLTLLPLPITTSSSGGAAGGSASRWASRSSGSLPTQTRTQAGDQPPPPPQPVVVNFSVFDDGVRFW